METWIKLYRKLRGHDIMSDPTALQIFIWILISVDYKTGTMTSGRFWGSEELKINPNTFYKALRDRVCKKYNLVTLTSNNKNTTISVNKWTLYQDDGNTTSNNEVTTKEQQSNTIQEDKEVKNIKTEEVTSICLTKNQLQTLQENFPAADIAAELRIANDYLKAEGKTKSNYLAWFRNWLRRKHKEGKKAVQQIPEMPIISEEERMRNLDKIKEIKSKLLK